MNNQTLARTFDDAANVLTAAGHGVIARRARALLADGDADAAIAFLTDAGERTPLMALDTLKAAVTTWNAAGQSAQGLRRDAAWKAGRERANQSADTIASMTEGADLPTLLQRLTEEMDKAAALDGAVEPVGTGPQAIGSIFGRTDTDGHPIVEETSNLVAKPLGLDGAAAAVSAAISAEPEPLRAPLSEAPEQVVVDTAQVPVSPPALPTAPAPPAEAAPAVAAKPAPAPTPAPEPTAIDVGAPKSVDMPDEPGSSLWIGLAIVVAAIVLLIWYTNRG